VVRGQAVNELIDRGGSDYGALSLLCDKHCAGRSIPLALEFCAHVNDREVIDPDLGGYNE